MKDLNKILYDILLKIENNENLHFNLNRQLVSKYFKDLKGDNNQKYLYFESYFLGFYNFCFELSLDNMIRDSINYEINYGSS